MESSTQVSSAPDSSVTVGHDAIARGEPASRTNEHTSRVLARGPFWARLPALRVMTSTVADSRSQMQGSDAPVVPPIVPPDRLSATRVLLSDTQACVQKLSARMDMLGSRSEQALKEVQLAREALEASNEKTVAEIADVAYKCQAALTKSIEAQGNLLVKISGDVAKLTISNDALLRLYETHSTSLASLTQSMHSITTAMQSLQAQHTHLISTLAPIEPVVRSIPSHVDALRPALERFVEHVLEHALQRSPKGMPVCEQSTSEHQTPRGTKRKRVLEGGVPSIEAAPMHRSTTMAPPSFIAQATREPSSPLLNRERRRSAIRSSSRLRPRRSETALPNQATSAFTGIMEVADPALAPEVLSQAPARSFSQQTARRSTFGASGVPAASKPTNKRPRTSSAAHIAAIGDASLDIEDRSVDSVSSIASPAVESSKKRNPAPTRLTRSAAKASAHTFLNTFSCVPLGPRQPEVACSSVDDGPGGVDKTVEKALPTGSENTEPHLVDKNKISGSKGRSKMPREKSGKTAKGKGKGKKAFVSPDHKSAYMPSVCALGSVEPDTTTSPKRTTTTESEASPASVVLLLGPQNSPSTHPKSSPILPDSNADGEAPQQLLTSHSIGPRRITSRARTLISLMETSQESLFLAGHMDGGTGDGAGLAAALAHLDRDINFVSGLGQDATQQQEGITEPKLIDDVDMSSRPQQGVESSSEVPNTLFRGRPRRFLVVDKGTAGTELLDDLFTE